MWWVLVTALQGVTFQTWLDDARTHVANDALGRDETRIVEYTIDVLRGRPIAPVDATAAAFRAEQLRGSRLSKVDRLKTVWKTLDAVHLRGNDGEGTVLWPASPERWSDETVWVPTWKVASQEERAALQEERAALQEELMLVRRALEEHGKSALSGFWLRYHAAWLSLRLSQSFAFSPTEAPAGWLERARLLSFELRFAEGEGSVELLHGYASLAAPKPAWNDGLVVRQLQIARRLGWAHPIESLLEPDGVGDAQAKLFVLAMSVARSLQLDDPAALIAGVVPHGELLLDEAEPNTAYIREGVLWAALRQPLTFFARLEQQGSSVGTVALVCKMGEVALAKRRLAAAVEMLLHCARQGADAAIRRSAAIDLALAAAIAGRTDALEQALRVLRPQPILAWQAAHDILTASGAYGPINEPILATLEAETAHWKLSRALCERMRQSIEAYRHGREGLPVVNVLLPAESLALSTQPFEPAWKVDEAFSLLPLPELDWD
jgi:hypothetical protein